MNRVNVRRLATAAFAFFWLGVSSAPAEVKLRIYMQDGSLQAGNLITETNDSFVVLGKDGRVELQKKNIMFVNGKTLKQWNERPDKLFQTEIIPSDVPNPAYVNDKAPLPLPPVPAVVKKPVIPPVQKLPETAAVVAPVPPAPQPAVAPKAKPAMESHAAAAKAGPKAHRKSKVAPAPDAAKSAVAAAPIEPVPELLRRPGGRRLADRAEKGALHREKGFAFLKQGRMAQAMQELMIARLLEPNNGDTNLALGQINKAEGLSDAALKYLNHWTLRKSDVAARTIADINSEAERNARRLFYMQIAAGVGAFAWLPVLLVYRRFRRRRVAAPVEVEEDAVVEAPRVPEWVRKAEASFVEPGAPAVPMAPPPLKMAPPLASKISAPPPPPVPQPVAPAPKPIEIVPEEELVEETPVVEEPVVSPSSRPPVEGEPEEVVVEPPAPEVLEPVLEEEPIEIPEPTVERVPQPLAASGDFDPREILSLARSVENSLVRANAAATAGRIDEARRSYRTALALNSNCASAHLGLGYLAFSEEKWDTSLLHYRKALAIDPGSADAHYGAARVLLEINRVDDAVPELRAALTLDPTYEDARDALTAIGKPA